MKKPFLAIVELSRTEQSLGWIHRLLVHPIQLASASMAKDVVSTVSWSGRWVRSEAVHTGLFAQGSEGDDKRRFVDQQGIVSKPMAHPKARHV